jgi:hypothetical protein
MNQPLLKWISGISLFAGVTTGMALSVSPTPLKNHDYVIHAEILKNEHAKLEVKVLDVLKGSTNMIANVIKIDYHRFAEWEHSQFNAGEEWVFGLHVQNGIAGPGYSFGPSSTPLRVTSGKVSGRITNPLENIQDTMSLKQLKAFLNEAQIDSAMNYVKKIYPGIVVNKNNDTTLSVIWESGADDIFRQLRGTLKINFGIDIVISAIE